MAPKVMPISRPRWISRWRSHQSATSSKESCRLFMAILLRAPSACELLFRFALLAEMLEPGQDFFEGVLGDEENVAREGAALSVIAFLLGVERADGQRQGGLFAFNDQFDVEGPVAGGQLVFRLSCALANHKTRRAQVCQIRDEVLDLVAVEIKVGGRLHRPGLWRFLFDLQREGIAGRLLPAGKLHGLDLARLEMKNRRILQLAAKRFHHCRLDDKNEGALAFFC